MSKESGLKPHSEHIDKTVINEIGRKLKSYDSMISDDEIRKAKDKFMDLYQKCEFAYKQLLIDYKINHEGERPDKRLKKRVKGKFNPNNLKIYNEQYPKVFKYAVIVISDRLFSTEEQYKIEGNKSCRVLRNEITHSSSRRAIKEVYDNKKYLFEMMRSFLGNFDQE